MLQRECPRCRRGKLLLQASRSLTMDTRGRSRARGRAGFDSIDSGFALHARDARTCGPVSRCGGLCFVVRPGPGGSRQPAGLALSRRETSRGFSVHPLQFMFYDESPSATTSYAVGTTKRSARDFRFNSELSLTCVCRGRCRVAHFTPEHGARQRHIFASGPVETRNSRPQLS